MRGLYTNPKGTVGRDFKYDSNFMDDKNIKDTESEEEEDAEDAEESAEEEEEINAEGEDSDESDSDESEDDEEESDAPLDDKDRDFDAEIAEENKRGKPDPKKAKEAFKERREKREGDDDKSLTRKEVEEILANDRKDRARDQALTIAKTLASGDKEAALIVAKWNNRTFPPDLALEEQITEMFGAVHAKRIVGQRNEALRALRGKGGVNNDAAGTHRDPPLTKAAPKMSAQDKQAITAVGFVWNGKNKRFEKKLANGNLLIKDNKTGQVSMVKAR